MCIHLGAGERAPSDDGEGVPLDDARRSLRAPGMSVAAALQKESAARRGVAPLVVV